MTGTGLFEYVKVGPVQFQRFGLHCFVWAWQSGNHRPVAKLYFGWRLSAGVWFGRDEDGDLTFAVSLFGAHLDVVVTTWEVPASLKAWAELEDADG